MSITGSKVRVLHTYIFNSQPRIACSPRYKFDNIDNAELIADFTFQERMHLQTDVEEATYQQVDVEKADERRGHLISRSAKNSLSRIALRLKGMLS